MEAPARAMRHAFLGIIPRVAAAFPDIAELAGISALMRYAPYTFSDF